MSEIISEGKFKSMMRALAATMLAPANRAPCADCEGEGYLFMPKSLTRRPCGECYGEGTVLVRNPFAATIGGALGGAIKK